MKVIILASGFSSKQLVETPYLYKDYTIVAVNHGFMVTDTWTYWVRARDFSGSVPSDVRPDQNIIKNYDQFLDQFGGHSKCGYSITLCASYWCLSELKPKEIGYLGADMNYTPNSEGHTHVYGLGLDFQKNGISDPDRMAQRYKASGETEDEYLKRMYMRFFDIAKENGCDVYNLSNDEDSRLPYPRKML